MGIRKEEHMGMFSWVQESYPSFGPHFLAVLPLHRIAIQDDTTLTATMQVKAAAL